MAIPDISTSAPLLYNYWSVFVGFGLCVLVQISIKYLWKNSSHATTDKSFVDRSPDEDNYVFQDSSLAGTDIDESFLHDPMLDEDWKHIPYKSPQLTHKEMLQKSEDFYKAMQKRRSVRYYSDKPVPLEIIQNIIKTAGTSPSGAHTEPWTYVVVSNKEIKKQIRHIIEQEEEINYAKRMGEKWVEALKPLNTNWEKEYLEMAPYIVVLFKQSYSLTPGGEKRTHYYHEISAAISVGLFLAAVQNAGLVSLTTTPMNAGPSLRSLLGRPVNEKVLLLLPVGYAADDATVPDFQRKPLKDIMVYLK